MTNITILPTHPGKIALDRANASSPILFPVAKRPLAVVGKGGRNVGFDSHVGLVRVDDAGEPVVLGVVGRNYGLVKNTDLLTRLESVMLERVEARHWANVRVKDRISYDGAWTSREYVFPSMNQRIMARGGFSTDVGMRFVYTNGYDGSTGVGLIGGLIDFICTNGMISSVWHEKVAKRHTRLVEEYPFERLVEDAIGRFAKETEELNRLGQVDVEDGKVEEFLNTSFSARRAAALLDRYRVEARTRGCNAFALLSAMTFYSSHDTGVFAVRRTGNDNVAAALAEREEEVAAATRTEAWRRLARVA